MRKRRSPETGYAFSERFFRDFLKIFEQEKALKSLSFKKLTGTPVPRCTHEFYLWSDKDAARGFGYFDGDVFIFEDMREHL